MFLTCLCSLISIYIRLDTLNVAEMINPFVYEFSRVEFFTGDKKERGLVIYQKKCGVSGGAA